jgi:hypothetical protein
MKFGLDVHRRVHVVAGRSLGYLFQWRAFCKRQDRDWRDAHGDYDEDILAGTAHSSVLLSANLTFLQCFILSWRARLPSSNTILPLAASMTGQSAGKHLDSTHQQPVASV